EADACYWEPLESPRIDPSFLDIIDISRLSTRNGRSIIGNNNGYPPVQNLKLLQSLENDFQYSVVKIQHY
uniref:Uncharacterized protein n=1 Tax=Romanomermis culicivorax TaxID=13658 RepID=A0A915IXT5_ROMCU